jgi:hypothetical protein
LKENVIPLQLVFQEQNESVKAYTLAFKLLESQLIANDDLGFESF